MQRSFAGEEFHLDDAHALKLGEALLIVWDRSSLWRFLVIPLTPGVVVAEDTVTDITERIHAGQCYQIQPDGIWNPILQASGFFNAGQNHRIRYT